MLQHAVYPVVLFATVGLIDRKLKSDANRCTFLLGQYPAKSSLKNQGLANGSFPASVSAETPAT